MKKLMAIMLLLSVMVGCKAQVRPTTVGGGVGVAVVISEEDKERFDNGLSKMEDVATKIADTLPVLANLARLAGDVSGDKDFEDKADDFAGCAGIGWWCDLCRVASARAGRAC